MTNTSYSTVTGRITLVGRCKVMQRSIDGNPFTLQEVIVDGEHGMTLATAFGEVAENLAAFSGRCAQIVTIDGERGPVLVQAEYQSGNAKSTKTNPRFLRLNRDGLTRI